MGSSPSVATLVPVVPVVPVVRVLVRVLHVADTLAGQSRRVDVPLPQAGHRLCEERQRVEPHLPHLCQIVNPGRRVPALRQPDRRGDSPLKQVPALDITVVVHEEVDEHLTVLAHPLQALEHGRLGDGIRRRHRQRRRETRILAAAAATATPAHGRLQHLEQNHRVEHPDFRLELGPELHQQRRKDAPAEVLKV
jgi:hypothetical protein